MTRDFHRIVAGSAHVWSKAVHALALCVALSVGCLVAGCADQAADDLKVDNTPPDQLYNDGLAQMQKGNSTEAVKKFEDLDRLAPYSDLARKAILLEAYTNFKKGDYIASIAAAKRFITIYPQSDQVPYAYYLIAESYYKQIPDLTRDQEMTKNALDAYNDILTKFPSSKFAEDARQKSEAVRDQLAGKEMDIGRFYLQKREFLAAINRFKTVVAQYQTTRHVEEALSRLVECYYALGVVPEAQTAAAVLGHNFPNSRWYKDSYTLLQSGGYTPQEDQGSWISKAFKNFRVF